MISVVSSNPTGGNFIFLRHLDANFVQKCVLFMKTSYLNEVRKFCDSVRDSEKSLVNCGVNEKSG